MAWKGKFDVQTIKITTNKGNTMFTIIKKKTLDDLKKRLCWEIQTNQKANEEIRQERELREKAEKKVNDQREVIVNMMILLDFFSQKLLRKHNKKGGKK